eukprot:Amastigsp_a188267_5.p4 type:complete len:182 gc:universal Amastigsp_a188267_5:398-943(+)
MITILASSGGRLLTRTLIHSSSRRSQSRRRVRDDACPSPLGAVKKPLESASRVPPLISRSFVCWSSASCSTLVARVHARGSPDGFLTAASSDSTRAANRGSNAATSAQSRRLLASAFVWRNKSSALHFLSQTSAAGPLMQTPSCNTSDCNTTSSPGPWTQSSDCAFSLKSQQMDPDSALHT